MHDPVRQAAPTTTTMRSLALATNSLDELLIVIDMSIERPQRRARSDLATENISLDPPWQDGADLMFHKSARRDGEDVIQFLL